MGLLSGFWSSNPDLFQLDAASAGSAAEMELRIQESIVGAPDPAKLVDYVLCGVGEGPTWECGLVYGAGNDDFLIERTGARVAAAVAGNRQEAYLRLQQRLAELYSDQAFDSVSKVEVAGGGDGTTFMAVAIVGDNPPE